MDRNKCKVLSRMLKKSARLCSRDAQRLSVPPREKSLSRQARGGRVKCIRFALKNCRLTASPASANVTLIILRVADLAADSLDRIFEHPADCSLAVLPFMDNPDHATVGVPQSPRSIQEFLRP